MAPDPVPAAQRARAFQARAARRLRAAARLLPFRIPHPLRTDLPLRSTFSFLKRPQATAWPSALASAVSAAVLLAGFAGALPAVTAGALAVGLSAAVHATLLVRLALAIHRGRRTFGPCRGAGFLGMGILAGGVTAVGLAGHPGLAGTLGLPGLVATTTLYLLGLLLLPGAATTVTARLQRLLDGGAVGICLFYIGWLLVLAPYADEHRPAVVAGLVASAAASVAVVTGLRAARYRPAALACSGGATLSITGLAGLVVAVGNPAPGPVRWLAAGALVIGPALATEGARRTGSRDPDPAAADGSFAGYPLLGIPIGAALLATAYQLIRGAVPDRIAIVLGLAAVAAVAVREALAAVAVRRYAVRLASQEAHFRCLVAGSSDVTVVVDADLVVRWLSPAAARQFALSESDVVGRPFEALVHPDDAGRVVDWLSAPGEADHPSLIEARLRDGYGRWRDTESTLSDLRGIPEVAAFVVHIRDIGDRRVMERTLRELAFTDQLTGLANRRALLRAVASTRSAPEPVGSVLVVDLDGLDGVTDVHGRELGDAVLIEAGRRLQAGLDSRELPARLAGDQFAVLTQVGSIRAYALANRLTTVLGEPYRLPGATVRLSANVGLAEIAGAGSVDEVLRRADLALVRAKRSGRGCVEWYDKSMEAVLLRRMSLEQELPGAIDRGELDLVYQPVMELGHGHPVGTEALLRWRHPRLGPVPPAELIPVAEDLGLADEVAAWVLHRACRQLSSWLREGWDLWLSVNVSARQLVSPAFVPALRGALEAHLVAAERILVEVAEQATGARPATEALEAAFVGVRAVGVRTAIDHFGADPTSLAHLRRMSIDVLKVDRSLFAEPAGRGGPAAPIMDVVMSLGDRLGLEVIACGLEAPAHLDVVRAAGCRLGQGHLFAAPAPAERVEAYLTDHRSPSL
jgi:diguanylate cyclase (GGDEF)-like protein/PAS domain S-box-containing protein